MAKHLLFVHYQGAVLDPFGTSTTYDALLTYYDDVTGAVTDELNGGFVTVPCDPINGCPPDPADQEGLTLPGTVVFSGCIANEPGEPVNRYREVTYLGGGQTNTQTTPADPRCGGNPCPNNLAVVATTTDNTDPVTPNGAIASTATSSAGGPYLFTLYDSSGQPIKNNATGTFSGLVGASYEVEAEDAAGCAVRTTVNVGSTIPCNISVDVATSGNMAFITNLGANPVEFGWFDNITYVSQPWNGAYLAGPQVVYVREVNNPACVVQVPFTIKPYPRGVCYRYALLLDGVYYPIPEPLEFDKLGRKLSRDKKQHGMAATFTEATLGFECQNGGDLLQEAYAVLGVDTEATLVEFVKDATTLYGYRTPYVGSLVFTLYEVRGTTVYIQVEAAGLPVKLTNRFKTVVDLYSGTSIDGTILPSFSPETATLHSRAIVKVGEARAPDGGGFSSYGFRRGDPGPRDPTIVLGFTNITTNDLETLNSQATGVSMSQAIYPVFQSKELLTNVTLTVRVDFRLKIILNTGDFDSVKLEFWLRRRGVPDEVLFAHEDQSVSGDYDSENYYGTPSNPTQRGVHCYRQYTGLNYVIGDEITVWGKVEVSDVSGSYYWTYETTLEETSFVRIEAETLLVENQAPVVPIYEATERVLTSTLGRSNLLRSNLFGRTNSLPTSYPVTGAGGFYVLATGFGIRGLSRPFPLSMEALLNGLNAPFCLGIGAKDEVDGEVIRLERAADFYEQVQVLELPNPEQGWKRTAAPDYVYNRVQLGFQDWKPDGRVENGLDEPVALRKWNTPVKNHDNEYKQLSTFIAGGYKIEAQRRVGLSSDDGPNDNDIFLVATSTDRGQPYPIQEYQDITGSPSGARSYIFYESLNTFKAGEKVTIVGGPNAGTYTVVFSGVVVATSQPYVSLVAVAEPMPNYNAGGLGGIMPRPSYKSERDEAFDVVNNLFSPSTVYNLRLSAGRLIYQHEALLGPALWPRPVASATYRMAAGEGNLNLETQLKTTDRNQGGVPVGKLVKEKDDIPAADMGGGKLGLFVPNSISVVHEMSETAFERLAPRRYGWVATQLETGKWYTGWIITATYLAGKATFELIERRSDTPYDPTTGGPLIEYNELDYNPLENN